jgi:flagellar assembly protein FliH
MTRVIKSAIAGSSVRPFPAPPAQPPQARRSPEAEEADRLRARLAHLEAALEERDAAIVAIRAEAEAAGRRLREEGYAAGLRDAADRQAERLDLLREAVGRADTTVRQGVEAMERTAVLLARDCLDMMLGETGERGRLVAGLLRHQVAQIDPAGLLRVEVSSEDFPDPATLGRLAAAAGLAEDAIVARPQLAAGGCVMVLRLGRIDAGLGTQWGALRQALSRIAEPEAAP